MNERFELMHPSYHAQGWILVKVTPEKSDSYYKIFADLGPLGWRLSSGSNSRPIKLSEVDSWAWPQSSGSLYTLPIQAEGNLDEYCMEELTLILMKSETQGIQVEIVELKDVIGELTR
ncbi:hypothetical protein [Pseudoalteromonas sp. T1lg24]|uniref:hypothetical protein n=1 Tax=Pseudoalteromonas sp. T1lg24 TaxID=2077099 RepID=UPI000CF6162C|nr:hypothetical protein [Pseudoalteromonas sp. T1lg24]